MQSDRPQRRLQQRLLLLFMRRALPGNNDSAGLRLSHLAKAETDKEKQTEGKRERQKSTSPLVPSFSLSYCKLFCISSTSLRIFTMKTKVNLLQFLHFPQCLSTFPHSTLIKWFPWKWQSIVALLPLSFNQRELFISAPTKKETKLGINFLSFKIP